MLLSIPGQRTGTLAGVIGTDAAPQAAVLGEGATAENLDDAQLAQLAAIPADGRPHNVDLGSLGVYRVVVQEPSSSGESLVVGLSLADVQATVVQIAILMAGIGRAGVGVWGVWGVVVVGLYSRVH